MNILLIGHEGYVGQGLLAYLSREHRVVGWDKKEDLFKLDAQVLKDNGIEMLINLSVMADRNSPTYSIDTPSDLVNVTGARHVAQILKGTTITWFQFSTREVLGPIYGPDDVDMTENGYRPKFLVDETRPYAPVNSYGKSKIMAEFISESHPYSNVIRLTTGYTDFFHTSPNWILNIIKSILAGKPATLTRGGEQFRDPLHTDDLARLMVLLHEKKVVGEKIHASGGKKSLLSLKEFVRVVNPQVEIQEMPGGDYGFAFDNAKAHRLVGWEPEIVFRERLPLMVENIRKGLGKG
jgi:nucleoside-diphosphate-sugar epimerase